MKLGTTLLLITFFSFFTAKADQYPCLNEEDAKKALAFFEGKTELIQYCSGCTDAQMIKIKIDSLKHEETEWCEGLVVYGRYLNTEQKDQKARVELDMAYTWVEMDGQGKNMAVLLRLPVYSVGEPFDWKTMKTIKLPKAKKKERKLLKATLDSIDLIVAKQKGMIVSNYEEQRVVVDSVRFSFKQETSEVEFLYYFPNKQQKNYLMQIKLMDSFKMQRNGRTEVLVSTEGTGFIQYLKAGEVFSSLNYRYHDLPFKTEGGEALVAQLNILQNLLMTYRF